MLEYVQAEEVKLEAKCGCGKDFTVTVDTRHMDYGSKSLDKLIARHAVDDQCFRGVQVGPWRIVLDRREVHTENLPLNDWRRTTEHVPVFDPRTETIDP